MTAMTCWMRRSQTAPLAARQQGQQAWRAPVRCGTAHHRISPTAIASDASCDFANDSYLGSTIAECSPGPHLIHAAHLCLPVSPPLLPCTEALIGQLSDLRKRADVEQMIGPGVVPSENWESSFVTERDHAVRG